MDLFPRRGAVPNNAALRGFSVAPAVRNPDKPLIALFSVANEKNEQCFRARPCGRRSRSQSDLSRRGARAKRYLAFQNIKNPSIRGTCGRGPDPSDISCPISEYCQLVCTPVVWMAQGICNNRQPWAASVWALTGKTGPGIACYIFRLYHRN